MLQDGESVVQDVLLRANSDLMVESLPVQGEVFLLEHHAATSRLDQTNHHLDRCCLSSTVVAEQGKDLTTIHVYVEIVDCFDPRSIELGQPLKAQNFTRLPLARILGFVKEFKSVEVLD